ncbi:MAG: hypothetical protein IIZ67_04815 [Bacilli bacterium]|nr:hypothetical protein [Bacilli bacterium]
MTNEEKKTIDKLKNGKKYTLVEIIRVFKKEGIENFRITRKEYLETILNLLKKQDNRIKELEADNYECNNIIRDYIEDWKLKTKIIDLMAEHLTTPIHSKKDVVEYFENLAKESGEIDEDKSN